MVRILIQNKPVVNLLRFYDLNHLDFKYTNPLNTHAAREANPSICTEIGLSAHFLCARGLPFSQVMYKLIIGF